MANDEHVALLEQGVRTWNNWRHENPDIRPDLDHAIMSWRSRDGINLSDASLRDATFQNSELVGANFAGAELVGANLSAARLINANLVAANLYRADLSGADVRNAELGDASLIYANLAEADLRRANLSGARLYKTVLAGLDLSETKGLEICRHEGPSVIDSQTLQRSNSLPLPFLRGVGLSDFEVEFAKLYRDNLANDQITDIAYDIARLRGAQPISYHSCFISYSSIDSEFARRLHADLQNEGIRCWFAPEDMKIGDRIRTRIDEVIRIHEKLLLVLSEASIDSDWVEKEVETAFEKERETKETGLFPMRVDDAVMDSATGWAADIRRSRHIGDFTGWKDDSAYQKGFQRLLRDLRLER